MAGWEVGWRAEVRKKTCRSRDLSGNRRRIFPEFYGGETAAATFGEICLADGVAVALVASAPRSTPLDRVEILPCDAAPASNSTSRDSPVTIVKSGLRSRFGDPDAAQVISLGLAHYRQSLFMLLIYSKFHSSSRACVRSSPTDHGFCGQHL